MDVPLLPTVNALLNAIATTLLIAGRRLARRKRIDVHRRVMLSAFGVSSVFLVLYVTDKVGRGFESVTYNVEGLARGIYLAFLASHVLLAMTVPVLAIRLIQLGLTKRFDSHRKLARVAWPIWMYVSITGVMIYFLLYFLNPAGP